MNQAATLAAAAPLDTITITEQHFEEVRSTGADLRVAVSESALGATTAGRLAALRRALSDCGFADGDMLLQRVERTGWAWIAIPLGIAAAIGVLVAARSLTAALAAAGGSVLLYILLAVLKLGTVSASLQVRCAGAEQVSRVLDTALALGADVESIAWRFDVAPADRGAWTVRAVEQARARADSVAAALGVSILGVHAFREEHTLPPSAYSAPFAAAQEQVVRKASIGTSAGQSLGAAPSSTERAGVKVTVEYRVAPLEVAGR